MMVAVCSLDCSTVGMRIRVSAVISEPMPKSYVSRKSSVVVTSCAVLCLRQARRTWRMLSSTRTSTKPKLSACTARYQSFRVPSTIT